MRSFAYLWILSTALGGDFWIEKKPSQWTQKDAQKLMARSPWAKDAFVQPILQGPDDAAGVRSTGAGRRINAPDSSKDPLPVPREPDGGAGAGAINAGDWGTGWGMIGPDRQTQPLLVRWESSEPIRAAEAKLEMEMPDRANDFYMISVSGFPRSQRLPPPDSRQKLKQLASLKIKGKDPIVPDDVEVLEGEKGIIMIFFFSRKTRIDAADKEVMFELENSVVHIDAKFVLKDMKFGGDLAL